MAEVANGGHVTVWCWTVTIFSAQRHSSGAHGRLPWYQWAQTQHTWSCWPSTRVARPQHPFPGVGVSTTPRAARPPITAPQGRSRELRIPGVGLGGCHGEHWS